MINVVCQKYNHLKQIPPNKEAIYKQKHYIYINSAIKSNLIKIIYLKSKNMGKII